MSNHKLISFIARSKRRREVLRLFSKGEKSQPEIIKTTGMYKSHTSRIIKEFVEARLIVCKNPENREFKFYRISALGKRILSEAEKLFSLNKG